MTQARPATNQSVNAGGPTAQTTRQQSQAAGAVPAPVLKTLYGFDREQVETIKNTVAKGATDSELAMLLHIAKKYDLDPLLHEIWFIKRVKKVRTGRKDGNGNDIWDYPRTPDGKIDYSDAETVIMTSRDGYLKAAMRDPDFDGIRSFTVCEGDEFAYDTETDKVTHRFGSKRGQILGAWAAAYHKKRRAAIWFAPFNEYNDPKSDSWRHYPSAMIQKVAEVFVLRRQFPLAGLVAQEELAILDAQDEGVMRNVTPGAGNHTGIGEPQVPAQPPATRSEIDEVIANARKAGLADEEITGAFQAATGRRTMRGWNCDRAEFDAWRQRITELAADKYSAQATAVENADGGDEEAGTDAEQPTTAPGAAGTEGQTTLI